MTLRRLILLCSLIGLTRSPVLADTEEIYRFERAWPVLPQPWYFDEIWDIAVSQQGYVYVVDRRNNRVQKWTQNGHLVSQLGTFSDGLRPIELAVDSQENVYVSYTTASAVDSGEVDILGMALRLFAHLPHLSHLIRKFNANGQLISDQWRDSAICPENIGHIAIDHQDRVYMTCVPKAGGQAFVHFVTSDGQWMKKWPIHSDGDIAIDRDHLYILDRKDNRVHKYTLGGDRLMEWKTDEKSDAGDFVYQTKDIAIDDRGNVYVTDNLNRIQKFDSAGKFLTQWRYEINTSGGLQILSQQLSPIQWQATKTGFSNQPCTTTDGVSGGTLEDVETCNQWQLFQALLNYESSFPTTIAIGPQNNVYVGYNMLLSAIKKYTSAGQPITQWANGGSSTPQLLERFKDLLPNMPLASERGEFQFHQPTDIAIDSNGYLYVTDNQAHKVLKFSKEGQLVQKWGELGDGEGQFFSPKGIAIDTDNNIYIVDTGNGRIQKFTVNGTFMTQWDGDSDPLALTYIALDQNNNVYVVDNLGLKIKKFTSDGHFLMAFGNPHLMTPWSIAVDNFDNIYVTDTLNGNIKKFSTNGDFLGEWHTQGNQNGQFVPLAVATDDVGNVYVLDSTNDNIQKFAPNGQFLTQWGTFGTNPGQFNFKSTDSLTVSPEGDRVYVVEQTNNRIQVFDRTRHDIGKAIIVAGGGPYDDNTLWEDTQMVANFAYRALAHQGFTQNTIYYLSAATTLDLDNNCQYNEEGVIDDNCYDVDEAPSNASLGEAITEWASDADNLTIYLTDHGLDQEFTLTEKEILTADALNQWLEVWQSQTQGHIKIVYDACYSGSFVQSLKAHNRIVITSAAADELAYFNDKGSLSFSNYFWTHVFHGLNLKESFSQAASAMNYMHQVETQSKQTPWLEANGDGCVNKENDYQQAEQFSIGNGTFIQADAPVIEAVSPPKTLTDTNTALIQAQVNEEDIARVWAVVRSPTDIQRRIQTKGGKADDQKAGFVGQPITELPSFELPRVKDSNRYEGRYDEFKIAGRYEVAIYASDNATNISLPKTTSVVVDTPFKRKAIMIAGELPAEAQNNLKDAYDTLKYQGYQSDNIHFISNTSVPGVDVTPRQALVENVEFALTDWAKNNSQNLVIYLEGLGDETAFELSDTERLPLAQLKTWLDALQPTIQGTVTVIYEGPSSGHLLAALKEPPEGQTRIVISSTDIGEVDLSDSPISFAQLFWPKVYNGADTYNAFDKARTAIQLVLPAQKPQLDGNGDGIGNDFDDNDVAKKHSIGIGVVTASDTESSTGNGSQANSRCLIPSQLKYRRGEQVTAEFEMLTDYDRYFAVGLPDDELFTIPSKNQFLPFQNVETAPDWSGGKTVIENFKLDANIPLGGYQLYSVTVPAGTPLESPLDSETMCQSGFCVEE